jgi:hypothetical protein
MPAHPHELESPRGVLSRRSFETHRRLGVKLAQLQLQALQILPVCPGHWVKHQVRDETSSVAALRQSRVAAAAPRSGRLAPSTRETPRACVLPQRPAR